MKVIALAAILASAAFAQHGHGPKGVPKIPAAPPVARAPKTVAMDPKLASRLQPLLPAGTTMDAAEAGFKNRGQFVAALHVSKNLGIPFDQLKAEMTGTGHKSLGDAIHTLKPDLKDDQVKAAVKTAEKEARADVKEQ